MTTESKSKLEGFLKDEKPSGGKPQTGQPDLKTTLERELEGEDSELAKELQRTRAEEIIARRRVAIERMVSARGGQDTGGSKIQDRGKEWLVDFAEGLLVKKLDPITVGRLVDYLVGTNAQFPQVGLPGAPAPAQGMTFTDMKEIFKMGQEANRTDPAIAAILDKLNQKITDIESRNLSSQPPTKTTYVLVKADGTIQEVESGKPIILEPKPTTGEPIDVVKERHRHAEKMEEIGVERSFKQKLGEVVEEIPVNLGKGWAAESASRQGKAAPSPSSTEKESVGSFQCLNPECKATIFYPLSNPPPLIKCAACGKVYEQGESAPPPPSSNTPFF